MARLSFTKLVGVMMLAAGAFALPQRIESLAMMDVSGQASSLASSLAHTDCEESAKPFKEGDDCVAQCSEGRAPDSEDNCEKCKDKEFADHHNKKCIASGDDCPTGSTANDVDNNCDDTCKDEEAGLFFDSAEKDDGSDAVGCVKTCPAGQTPGEGGVYKVCTDCAKGKYADHEAHECVETCPAGYAGNDDKDCEQCAGATPYADHVAHECVATCPSGYAGNDDKDCEQCEGDTPYADHVAHLCVAECPKGAVGHADTNECVACKNSEFADHDAKICQASKDKCPDGSTANDDDNNCDHTCEDEEVGLFFDNAKDDNDDAVGCVEKCPAGQTADEGGVYKVCTATSAPTPAPSA